MAQPRKKLPGNFVHFRCASSLTEALDEVAARHDITRSEAARIIMELYLHDDIRSAAANEGISRVRHVLHVAQGRAFEAYKEAFFGAIDDMAGTPYGNRLGDALVKRPAPLAERFEDVPDEDALDEPG